MQEIVARASNRAFVGLPLCESKALPFQKFPLPRLTERRRVGRNEKYLALAIDFATDFVKQVLVLRLFPRVLKP